MKNGIKQHPVLDGKLVMEIWCQKTVFRKCQVMESGKLECQTGDEKSEHRHSETVNTNGLEWIEINSDDTLYPNLNEQSIRKIGSCHGQQSLKLTSESQKWQNLCSFQGKLHSISEVIKKYALSNQMLSENWIVLWNYYKTLFYN